ncbi:fumarate hydratase [Clostridiaceae bacterium HSG29]|nr:fumarate hydratase [Clostridiaceae bacterium HSG29]
MRIINTDDIVNVVKEMCIESNFNLNSDIKNALAEGEREEESPIGKEILKNILINADISEKNRVPMCQDTGMVVVFVEIGEEVFIDGNIKNAINEGVRLGYKDGFLRKSVVSDPIIRENTNDNTPAVIHYDFVKGSELKITIAPKGFGSENMGKLKMLKPSDGIEGVRKFILETVSEAGPNPCPPIVVGVGIGGTMDKVTEIAKKALIRPINKYNEIKYIEEFEKQMLLDINRLGIGPQGLGGTVTAIGVNVEIYPTHIAGLPVAVNINCHASRHMEVIL